MSQTSSHENHMINDLQVELLQSIFEFLDTRDLFLAQRVCRLWHVVINKPTHADDQDDEMYRHLSCSGELLWANHVLRRVKAVITATRRIPSSSRESAGGQQVEDEAAEEKTLNRILTVQQWKQLAKQLDGVLASMEERRLQWDRTKQERARTAQSDEQMPQQGFINRQTWDVEYDVEQSMILKPMHASTHDDARQNVDQTRIYFDSIPRFGSFWSSIGSDEPSDNEYLTYMLKEPSITPFAIVHRMDMQVFRQNGIFFAVIDELRVKPFLAHWQNNNIYPPRSVSLSIGLTPPSGTSSQNDTKFHELFTSEELYVDPALHEYHRLRIGPILLIGDILCADDQRRVTVHTNPRAFDQNLSHNTGKQYEFNSKQMASSAQPSIVDMIMGEESDAGLDRQQQQHQQQDDDEDDDEDEEQGAVVDQEIMMEAFEMFGGELTRDVFEFVRTRMNQKHQMRLEKSFLAKFEAPFMVRVNLLGKVQKQPDDDKYYSCIELLDIVGQMRFLE